MNEHKQISAFRLVKKFLSLMFPRLQKIFKERRNALLSRQINYIFTSTLSLALLVYSFSKISEHGLSRFLVVFDQV